MKYFISADNRRGGFRRTKADIEAQRLIHRELLECSDSSDEDQNSTGKLCFIASSNNLTLASFIF